MPRKPNNKGVNAKGRNKGEGQYMPLPYNLTKSGAFRSLSGNALKVFIELRSRFNGVNNGRLSLSYQDAADLLGMSKSSVKRAFDELIEKGFLKKRREGQWYGRLAAEYIVTMEAYDGLPATRDWKQWTESKTCTGDSSVSSRHVDEACSSKFRADGDSVRWHRRRQATLRVVSGNT
ncbi:helix-turn-helix domain-containing protein [Hyphomonas jannaschiana]|uniref:helix-turn-helix domain-containing protein n=1 Tax=Hyphomonas jannaschiana TaxID=86 RepID=UPI0035C6951E